MKKGENVKELLEEMKNLSELALDLSYSSILFENKDIAEEVIELYEKINDIEDRAVIHLFAASRGKGAEKVLSILEMIDCSRRVAGAANDLATVVSEGEGLHPIVKEALEETDETITKIIASKKSPVANKTIGELRLRTHTGVDVIAIKRKKWIWDPGKNTKIMPRDMVIAVGTKESCAYFEKLLKGEVERIEE